MLSLETTQIRLRPVQSADLPNLSVLRNDFALQLQLLSSPRPNTIEQVQAWLQKRSSEPDSLFFVIAKLSDDECLGFVQLTQIQLLHGHASLGICLAPKARGQGYAKQALALLETYATAIFNLRKILLEVRADNQSAIRLYTQSGYRPIGVLESHFFAQGSYHDVLMMEKRLA